MSVAVYANGMSIACKVADGKTIAAFPDVCLSPPAPPIPPIPYPNTAAASDTTDGSKTVQIGGEEVMLKDKSTFKTSTGNEAATKSFGMGVVTHQITGKCNFVAWSMDVKFEGENVPRHMDLMGHNEASKPPNTPPWAYFDSMTAAQLSDCSGLKKDVEDNCKEIIHRNTYSTGRVNRAGAVADMCKDDKCSKATKCMLVEYGGASSPNCCPGKTGHHLVEVHGFCASGDRNSPQPPFDGSNGMEPYDQDKAPCICATSPNSNWEAEHGDLHSVQGVKENYAIATAATRNPPRSSDHAWTYGEARQAGVDAQAATFNDPKCNEACMAAQLDAYHKNRVGVDESTPLRTETYGFGTAKVDQRARGVQLIKDLVKQRLGDVATGMFP